MPRRRARADCSHFDSIRLGAVGSRARGPNHVSRWSCPPDPPAPRLFPSNVNLPAVQLVQGRREPPRPARQARRTSTLRPWRREPPRAILLDRGRMNARNRSNEYSWVQESVSTARAFPDRVAPTFAPFVSPRKAQRRSTSTSSTKSNASIHQTIAVLDRALRRERQGIIPTSRPTSSKSDIRRRKLLRAPPERVCRRRLGSNLVRRSCPNLGPAIPGEIGIAPSATPSIPQPLHSRDVRAGAGPPSAARHTPGENIATTDRHPSGRSRDDCSSHFTGSARRPPRAVEGAKSREIVGWPAGPAPPHGTSGGQCEHAGRGQSGSPTRNLTNAGFPATVSPRKRYPEGRLFPPGLRRREPGFPARAGTNVWVQYLI